MEYHGIILSFPLLGLMGIIYSIVMILIADNTQVIAYISFWAVVFFGILNTICAIHYVCISRRKNKQEQQAQDNHYFIFLLLALYILTVGLCVRSYLYFVDSEYLKAKWFSIFLTSPFSLLSLGFGIATSIIVYVNIRNSRQGRLEQEQERKEEGGSEDEGDIEMGQMEKKKQEIIAES